LSKSGKKRGRSKRNDGDSGEDNGAFNHFALPTPAPKFGIDPSKEGAVLNERQFQELRKEHKRTRKLIQDQYQEFEIFTQYTLDRIDFTQQSLNLIMNHLRIPLPTPDKQGDSITTLIQKYQQRQLQQQEHQDQEEQLELQKRQEQDEQQEQELQEREQKRRHLQEQEQIIIKEEEMKHQNHDQEVLLDQENQETQEYLNVNVLSNHSANSSHQEPLDENSQGQKYEHNHVNDEHTEQFAKENDIELSGQYGNLNDADSVLDMINPNQHDSEAFKQFS